MLSLHLFLLLVLHLNDCYLSAIILAYILYAAFNKYIQLFSHRQQSPFSRYGFTIDTPHSWVTDLPTCI